MSAGAQRDGASQEPRVSLVIRTTGGRLGALQRAVASVLAQDHRGLEIVVVEDGGSAAADWLASVEPPDGKRILFRPLPRAGRCAAGNRGLELARGRYLGFLDDDDELFPAHVSTLVGVLEREPGVGGAFAVAERALTEVRSWTPFVFREARREVVLREPFDRGRLWLGNLFPIQACLFRRELFEEHGGFHPDLDRLEDWDLWVRYTARAPFAFVDRVTSMYRVPADPGERRRRRRAHDEYLPRVRQLQGRVRVSVTREDLVALADAVLTERKPLRMARAVVRPDLGALVDRSPAARALLDRAAEATGAAETSPAEAVDVARRVVAGSPLLRLAAGVADAVRRRPAGGRAGPRPAERPS